MLDKDSEQQKVSGHIFRIIGISQKNKLYDFDLPAHKSITLMSKRAA
jgi:hypothetical protein